MLSSVKIVLGQGNPVLRIGSHLPPPFGGTQPKEASCTRESTALELYPHSRIYANRANRWTLIRVDTSSAICSLQFAVCGYT
jgi:hypothetical protein